MWPRRSTQRFPYSFLRLNEFSPAALLVLLIFAGGFYIVRELRIPHVEKGWVLGTYITISIEGPQARPAARAAWKEIKRVEQLAYRWNYYNGLNLLNRRQTAQLSDPDIFTMVSTAQNYWRLSGGYLDITLLPLEQLWDFERKQVPSDQKIKGVLPAVGMQHVSTDPKQQSIAFMHPATEIDLSAITTGYALDRAREQLLRFKITYASINAGDVIVTVGHPILQLKWTFQLKYPWEPGFVTPVPVKLKSNQALAFVHDRQTYFKDSQGEVFHNILNPFTGYPIHSGYRGVLIVSDSAFTANCLALAVFGAGKPLPADNGSKVRYIVIQGDSAAELKILELKPSYAPTR